MAVAYSSIAKTVVASATDTMSCTHPAGLAADDLLLMAHLVHNTTAPTVDTPSGWTQILQQAGPTNSRPRSAVFGKVATAADVAAGSTTFTISAPVAGAEDWKSAGIRVTGIDPNATWAGQIIDTSDSGAASADPLVCPTVTTTIDGCLIIFGGGCTNPRTGTAPAGSTERLDTAQDGDGNGGLLVYTDDTLKDPAGATGTYSVELVSADDQSKWTIAIAPFVDKMGNTDTSTMIDAITAPTGAFGGKASTTEMTITTGGSTRWGAILSTDLLENVDP